MLAIFGRDSDGSVWIVFDRAVDTTGVPDLFITVGGSGVVFSGSSRGVQEILCLGGYPSPGEPWAVAAGEDAVVQVGGVPVVFGAQSGVTTSSV